MSPNAEKLLAILIERIGEVAPPHELAAAMKREGWIITGWCKEIADALAAQTPSWMQLEQVPRPGFRKKGWRLSRVIESPAAEPSRSNPLSSAA